MKLAFDQDVIILLIDLLDAVEIFLFVCKYMGSAAAGFDELIILHFQQSDNAQDLDIKLNHQVKLYALV